jgi:16S rRNA U516 pseudouridylate synthase RsuA-like enzyme
LSARPAAAGLDQVAQVESEAKAAAADTFEQAFDDTEPPPHHEPVSVHPDEPAQEPAAIAGEHEGAATENSPTVADVDEAAGFTPEPRPPAKLERLQKILSQAGIASRRHAEEMITEGRVQVNGKVITELGSKADAGRDHIRVDGKLLQGAERLRYFMLNKPRGYVTTVSDPEGRPTVMQIFSKMSERLYPVGRLDYLSEGLLLVTNDGDLANKLTKAATGVEKTYLVKVSGQPSEAELDVLRQGKANRLVDELERVVTELETLATKGSARSASLS